MENQTMLSADLIFEILLRLPVKSLLRFKSVSKNWKSLITNPTFTNSQFQLSKNQRSSHVVYQYRSIFTFHLNLDHLLHDSTAKHFYMNELVPISSKFFKLKFGNSDIVGSCNGIICIHLTSTRNLCLWNPTIDEARFISFPINYQLKFVAQIIFSGFGYAAAIDDYKIVLVVQHSRCLRSIAVYSLRRDEWRELDYDFYLSTIPQIYSEKYGGINIQYNAIRMEAAVLDDALHWIMGNKGQKHSEFFILRFDMVNEYFEKFVDLNKIGSFDDDDDENIVLHQTEIGVTEDNKIGVYLVYNEFCHQQQKPTIKRDVIEIRVMVDQQGNSWKTKFRYQGRWEDERVHNDLVSIAGNGKVLIFDNIRMQVGKLGKLQLFDISQGEPCFIQLHNRYSPPFRSCDAVSYTANYVPSLLSPISF